MRSDEDDELEREFQAFRRAACQPLPAPKRRNRQKERFVQVPLWWAEQAAKATRIPAMLVCLELLDRAWQAKSATFPLPNGRLGKSGASREIKRRVLRDLERVGLITVERPRRKTPIVTLVVL